MYVAPSSRDGFNDPLFGFDLSYRELSELTEDGGVLQLVEIGLVLLEAGAKFLRPLDELVYILHHEA